MAKGVIIEHDIAGDEEFNHHVFYTEFLARFGFRYSAMVGFTAGDTMLSLNLQRRIQDQPFDRDDEQLLIKMQSKLTVAAEIVRALHVARIDSMSEAFELAGTAVVFFDPPGRRRGSETDFGANVLAGVGWKGLPFVPYLQGKVLLSDETEVVAAAGIRF